MLFCEYPFERAGVAAGGKKFQKVLDRIRRVDFRFPAEVPVSAECKDLISKILVADVNKRCEGRGRVAGGAPRPRAQTAHPSPLPPPSPA